MQICREIRNLIGHREYNLICKLFERTSTSRGKDVLTNIMLMICPQTNVPVDMQLCVSISHIKSKYQKKEYKSE